MSMDDYYKSIAWNIVRQWKDWLRDRGDLKSDLAKECEDMLIALIAARLRIDEEKRTVKIK